MRVRERVLLFILTLAIGVALWQRGIPALERGTSSAAVADAVQLRALAMRQREIADTLSARRRAWAAIRIQLLDRDAPAALQARIVKGLADAADRSDVTLERSVVSIDSSHLFWRARVRASVHGDADGIIGFLNGLVIDSVPMRVVDLQFAQLSPVSNAPPVWSGSLQADVLVAPKSDR